MDNSPKTEAINCPYCDKSASIPWGRENGFTAVKCPDCGLIYVNPRPIPSLISEAVKTGMHSDVERLKNVVYHRVGSKVSGYKKIISSVFADVWQNNKPIFWLDVGAGYGEFVEAVSALAPKNSTIEGLEPMKPKAEQARARGLNVNEAYLSTIQQKFDFLSLINIFSHIPDFREFLKDVKRVLTENGEIFIETGNGGDLTNRRQFPTELNLPDHLVFAGEQNIIDYLSEAGFSIVVVKRIRKDGLINFAKNIVKKIIGRPVLLSIPYTSPYRTLLVRARLN